MWILGASEHTLIPNEGATGGPRHLNAVNRAGLIRLTMRSDKPIARSFQDWAVKVLDTTIETGSYVMGEERLDPDEWETITLDPIEGIRRRGNPTVITVSESGLWAAVLRSDKPVARELRKWITGTVIPSLRKHGGYIVGQETMSAAETMAAGMVAAEKIVAEERARRLAAEGTVAARESPFHPLSPPLAPLHPALPTRRQGLSVPPHGQGQRRRLPHLQPHRWTEAVSEESYSTTTRLNARRAAAGMSEVVAACRAQGISPAEYMRLCADFHDAQDVEERSQ